MKKQTLLLAGLLAFIAIGFVLPMVSQQARVSSDATVAPTESKPAVVKTEDFFTSPAGIIYGKDWSGKFDSRVAHIMAHTREDASKPKHSVFIKHERDAILLLLDEAWKKRGPPTSTATGRGRDVYDVPMARVVGKQGEQRIRLIMEKDSAMIVTAYPVQ